jgi:hypothetical protein
MMENTVPNFHREEGKNIREFPAGIKRETKNKCERGKGKRIPPENRNGRGKTKYGFTL